VSEAALRAGKLVYVVKPLSSCLVEARALLDLADSKSLVVGCAPDTVLGAGIQTCRRLVDDGSLGEVTTGFASMLCPGHEAWHPAPAFYYNSGGGPMWDMGPYYLTALVWLLGPIAAVTASASTPRSERTVASGPKAGERVPVETPTTIAATLELVSGAVVQFLVSFDVAAHDLPHLELHGQRGALRVPDPNGFGGAPLVREASGWQPVPLDPGLNENARGIGVREMARAIERGATPRCSGEVALHIVEVMAGALDSATRGSRVTIASRPSRPAPFRGGEW
ncbi:MAG: Gfo/Idh/MocA family protein, partial [Fimbriimonadaceae bacterium]